MDKVEAVVIGAGVIGLALGRALAQQGLEVLIAEKETAFGTETSARNSEVIHAGIYYKKDSLKARTCVRGKQMLYEYLKERDLPHSNCGKLIVACSEDEIARLAEIQDYAAQNGVDDLQLLSADDVKAREPELISFGGLFSPSTGIVDSHHYMLSLLGDMEVAGGVLSCQTRFVDGYAEDRGGIVLCLESQGQEMEIMADHVFNCAGLYADQVARSIKGVPPQTVPQLKYAKGNYFTLSGKTSFRHLVYPVPVAGGLGTHLTLDLAGQARFGPDVEWVDAINYDVDARSKDSFVKAIARYWPRISDFELHASYAGIRPKLDASGAQDFAVQTPNDHGIAGLYNLYGIESPGLTASLALADYVAEAVKAQRLAA